MNGYELPVAMEVRRGRYLHSYEQLRSPQSESAPGVARSPCAIMIMLFSKATV